MKLAAVLSLSVIGLVGFLALRSRRPAEPERAVSAVSGSVGSRRAPVAIRPDSLLAVIRRAAPFRPDRRDLGGGASPGMVQAAESARPGLFLRGIVWASTPTAAIEGWPGATGQALVAVGDTSNGLAVARISRSAVVITSRDSAWTLRFDQP